jgi:hypothetical protein
MLGEDVLYVQKWPWGNVEDWWNYINRPPLRTEMVESLNRIIEQTPGSNLEVAVPIAGRGGSVKAGQNRVSGVMIIGTSADYSRTVTADVADGRLFTDFEASAGRQVVVLGSTVADQLFPGRFRAGPDRRYPRPALRRDRRAGQAGRVSRAIQLRQSGDCSPERDAEKLRCADGDPDARQGEG